MGQDLLMETGADETFRRSLRGTVTSSQGYRVRVESRTSIRYWDEHGRVDLDCEVLAGPEDAILLLLSSWPETWGSLQGPDLISRVTAALSHEGWDIRP